MLKTCLLFFVLLLSFPAFGNSPDSNYSDSLTHLIEGRHYHLADQYVDSLLASGQYTSHSYSSLLQKKADVLYYLNDNEKAFEYYLKSASQEELRGDQDLSLICTAYGNAAYCLINLGLFEESIHYSQLAYRSAFKNGDSVEMAITTANMGLAYKKLGNYNAALSHYEESYALDQALKDSIGMAYDLNNLAAFFLEWGKLDQAMVYYKESLAIMIKANLKKQMAARYGNIATLYLKKDELVQAERNVAKAIIIDKEIGDSLTYAKHLGLLGQIKVRKNKPKIALGLHYQALEIYTRFKALEMITICNRNLAEAYFYTMQTGLALARLDSAISVAEENDFFQELVGLYLMKIKYLRTIESSAEISILEKKVDILKDSMYSMENSNHLHQLELANELNKKDAEIEKIIHASMLQAEGVEIGHRKRLLWVILGLCMIAALVYVIVHFRQKNKRLAYQLEIDALQNKVNALLHEDPDSFNIKLNDVNEQLVDPLSEREFQILKFTFTQKSNAEIAEELDVSVNTIKFHFKNIFKKFGVKNRKEVLQFLLAA